MSINHPFHITSEPCAHRVMTSVKPVNTNVLACHDVTPVKMGLKAPHATCLDHAAAVGRYIQVIAVAT